MRITNQKETTDNILGLSPMPFQDQLKIDYSLIKGGEVIFIILNEDGKQVISEKINAIEGFSFYTLNNLSSLPVGVYFLIMKSQYRMLFA